MAQVLDPNMINIYFWAGLLIFIAGVLLLRRTKFKRVMGIFTLVETRHGLKFIDTIASISPRAWQFLADSSTVFCFGGVGGLYLSKVNRPGPKIPVVSLFYHPRRTKTERPIAFLGILLALFYLFTGTRPEIVAAYLAIVFALYVSMAKMPNKWTHFISSTVISGIFLGVLATGMGLPIELSIIPGLFMGIFGLPSFLVAALANHAPQILLQQTTLPGASPALPGVSPSTGELGLFFPGTTIFIPIWQALVALILVLAPHELSHGILSRTHKIRLQSAGILTAGPIPVGAFVEPDEKEFKRSKSIARMRVFVAGSAANLAVSIICMLLLIFVLAPASSGISESTGMRITSVTDGLPAKGVIEPGTIVTDLNGKPTPTTKEFNEAAKGILPGEVMIIRDSQGKVYEIRTVASPDDPQRGIIGITLAEEVQVKAQFQGTPYAGAVLFLAPTLFWAWFLSFNIAIVNLLPFSVMDGGKVFDEVMGEFRVSKRRKKHIHQAITYLILGLILINFLPAFNNLADILMSFIGGA